MSQEDLIPGLKLVSKKKITPEECKILFCILEKPYTAEELALESKKSLARVYGMMKVLELKGVVKRYEEKERKVSVYQFDESALDN